MIFRIFAITFHRNNNPYHIVIRNIILVIYHLCIYQMKSVNIIAGGVLFSLATVTQTYAQIQGSPMNIEADSTATNITTSATLKNSDNTGGGCVTLSREKCVQIALDNNPTIRVADMEIERMDYSKKEILAGLFPTLDFSASYQRSIELQSIKMDMGGSSQSIKMGSDNTWNMGFNVSLTIIAPTLWKSLDISDTQILINRENARASRIDMVNAVNKAYYALLLAEASKKVLQQNYDNAKFNADLYEKKFKVGTASEYDVLRSSVQVKNVEPELLQADIAVKQAKLQLKVLMGMDYNVDIEPDVKLEDMQRDMYDYTGSINTGLQDNTSMRSLALNTELMRQTLDLKKRAFLPTVAATFNLSWASLSNGNMFKNIDFQPYSNVGIAVSVPIFTGGSRYYGVKGAKVQLAEMQLQRENLERNLRMQVDLAIDNINLEVKQIDTSAEGVRQAVKAHEIMQKSFEIGAATYLDLRDSELAETSAKLVYLQAIYNYLISTSELDSLLGKGANN